MAVRRVVVGTGVSAQLPGHTQYDVVMWLPVAAASAVPMPGYSFPLHSPVNGVDIAPNAEELAALRAGTLYERRGFYVVPDSLPVASVTALIEAGWNSASAEVQAPGTRYGFGWDGTGWSRTPPVAA